MKLFAVFLALLGCLLGQAALPSEMSLVTGGILKPFFKEEKENEFLTKSVPAFYLDKYPVTNNDYLSFVKANPEWKRSKVKYIFVDKNYLSLWKGDESFPNQLRSIPVVNVSWFAAKAFCESQGKRLPTTDEWEVAAQASEASKDASTDEKFLEKILNWYSQPNELRAVGKGQKNIYNIYDLHGLVWEWVYDFNSLMLNGDSREEKGRNQKFYCGSGAYQSKDNRDYAAFMRFGFRSSLNASYTVSNLGFRCAKSDSDKKSTFKSDVSTWPSNSLYNLPIEFQNQDGTAVKLKDLRAPVQIMSMVYTGCPSVCPLTVQILKKIAAQFSDPKKVQFVLVSFDTEKDKPEVLKAFAKKNHLDPSQYTLLHGNSAAIRMLAVGLGLNYKQNSKGDFYHSNNLSLIAGDGVLRYQEKSFSEQDEMAKEIKRVLANISQK